MGNKCEATRHVCLVLDLAQTTGFSISKTLFAFYNLLFQHDFEDLYTTMLFRKKKAIAAIVCNERQAIGIDKTPEKA